MVIININFLKSIHFFHLKKKSEYEIRVKLLRSLKATLEKKNKLCYLRYNRKGRMNTNVIIEVLLKFENSADQLP